MEVALAALDLAILAFKHGPTLLHHFACETAIMAMGLAMQATPNVADLHDIACVGRHRLSLEDPLHPSICESERCKTNSGI